MILAWIRAIATPFLPYIIAGAIGLASFWGWGAWKYSSGYSAGQAAYKAKVEKAIEKAITKGDTARENALRDFDKTEEVPNDGFARD